MTNAPNVFIDSDSVTWERIGPNRLKAHASGAGSVNDADYSAAWDGDTTHAPSKNAVYDKIETLSGGSGGTSELWALPDSPDASDDEFTSNSLDGSWTLYDSDATTPITPSGSIDPYATITSGARIQTNTYKRSWLAAQVKNTGVPHYLMKSYTPNTNDVVWARLGHTIRKDQSQPNFIVELSLMAATAGHPDPNNFVLINYQCTGSAGHFATKIIAAKIVSGSGTIIYDPGTATADNIVQNPYGRGQYFIIQKRSTDYDFWVADGLGTIYWLGTTSFSPTLAYMGFRLIDDTSTGTNPGNAIFYSDFIRVVQNTSVFLP